MPWSSGWCQTTSITSSISRSEHHRAFMGQPGVQSAKWISTSFIPQSFPSSMKGKHPITYSPKLVRQHSMWDRNSSEGWSYYLIRHLMFKHSLKYFHSLKKFSFSKTQRFKFLSVEVSFKFVITSLVYSFKRKNSHQWIWWLFWTWSPMW